MFIIESAANSKKILSQVSLETCFERARDVAADEAIANYFYRNTIAFNAIDSLEWEKMIKALKNTSPSYNSNCGLKIGRKMHFE